MRFLNELPDIDYSLPSTEPVTPPGAELSKDLTYSLAKATSMFSQMFVKKVESKVKASKHFEPLTHDKFKAAGYNLGFKGGTFATQLPQRDYFEKVIRPANKKNFTPGIIRNRNARNNATFIDFDKQKRENFNE